MNDPSRPDPRDPHYFSKLLMRSKPSVDSPLGDLIVHKITPAEYRQRVDAKRVREGLPPGEWDPDPLTAFLHEPVEPPERRPRGLGCWSLLVVVLLAWWLA